MARVVGKLVWPAARDDVKRVASEWTQGANGRTSSTPGASFNVFCTVVGTGLLQVAYGGSQTGWVGLALLLSMGAMSLYTAIVIAKSVDLAKVVSRLADEAVVPTANEDQADVVEKVSANPVQDARPPETFSDVAAVAYGEPCRWFVNVQLHLGQVLFATVYNLLGGINVAAVTPESWEWMTPEVATLLVSCAMWFHVFLKTLGEVSWVSAVNLCMTLLLAAVVITESLRNRPADPVDTVVINWDVFSLGAGFASFCGAWNVHFLLPSVYRSMRRPSEYEPMIKSTFLLVAVVTVPMLVVGYGVYGDQVRSPIYETPALARTPLVKVMVGLVTIHLIGAYALVLNPTEMALETALRVDERRCSLLWQIALRTCFVVFSCGMSIAIRNQFPPFLELVSAFTSTFMIFILPCVCYVRLSALAGQPLCRMELLWNLLICVCAVFGAFFWHLGCLPGLGQAALLIPAL